MLSLSGGLFLGGYSYVSDLPPPLLQDWRKDEAGIISDLRAMFGTSDQERTILSIHVPPKDRRLDMNFEERHIGSSAVTEYLEESKHPLVLVGHVHEVVENHGRWKDRIGNTLIATPGAARRGGVDALLVDSGDIANVSRIKIS